MQGGRETGAFGGRAGEIVELQFYENLCDRSSRLFLREIGHHFLKQIFQFLFALLDGSKIDRERFLCAERFARAIRFDQPVIDTAAKIVELDAEFAEKIDNVRTREALQLATGFNAELFQFFLSLLPDAPNFADRKIFHEAGNLFRYDFKLTVRLVYFARDPRDEFVRANPRR